MNNEEIVKIVLDELRDRGLIKERRKSAYASTEALLYNYGYLKQSIIENRHEIEDLKANGLPKKSKSIVALDSISTAPREEECVLVEERISYIEQSIVRTEAIISKINRLLREYGSPKYPDLIKRIYFDGQTREELAEIYQCDVSTISRNRAKIINQLKIILFPSELINELGC